MSYRYKGNAREKPTKNKQIRYFVNCSRFIRFCTLAKIKKIKKAKAATLKSIASIEDGYEAKASVQNCSIDPPPLINNSN